VFFVPASAFGPDVPYAKDGWVVHFDDPIPSTDPDAEVHSCDGPLIVRIDPITGQARIVMLL